MRQNRIFPGHSGRGRLGEVRQVTDLPGSPPCELCALARRGGVKATGLRCPPPPPPALPCRDLAAPNLQGLALPLGLSSGAGGCNAAPDSCTSHTTSASFSPSGSRSARPGDSGRRRGSLAHPERAPLWPEPPDAPGLAASSAGPRPRPRRTSSADTPGRRPCIRPRLNPAPLPAGAPSVGCAPAAERPGARGKSAGLPGGPSSQRLGTWAGGEAAGPAFIARPAGRWELYQRGPPRSADPAGAGWGVAGAGARRRRP